MQRVLPVVAIDVYGFRPGSVIAEYYIIMNPDAPVVNISTLQSAVTNVISSGNLTGLNVDTSFRPNITQHGKNLVSIIKFFSILKS